MTYFRDNIEKLDGYVPGEQPADADVIKLNTNENPYPPSPRVIDVLRNINPEKLRKYPQPFGDEFRTAAAKIHGVSPENIICTNGGDELLSLCVRAFCAADRALAYPVPTYSLYPVLAKIENCPAVEIPFDEQFNLPAKLAKTHAALTIVCNPNAPSATFVPINELASLADELNGVLLIDEAYADFAEDNAIRLIKDFDNVIILRSLSKGYSLAGLRFGYGIADRNLINGLIKIKDSYNADAIALAAAKAAVEDRRYFSDNIEKIKAERNRLTENLRKLGFKVARSHTNFVQAQWRSDAQELYEKLKSAGILVRYWKSPQLADKLRITVGTARQNDRLIEQLKNFGF